MVAVPERLSEPLVRFRAAWEPSSVPLQTLVPARVRLPARSSSPLPVDAMPVMAPLVMVKLLPVEAPGPNVNVSSVKPIVPPLTSSTLPPASSVNAGDWKASLDSEAVTLPLSVNGTLTVTRTV